MKRYLENHPTSFRLLSAALAFSLALPLPVFAATVDLATVPMNSATTTSVRPNLMFILDNSGSMGQDFTPDYMSNYSYNPSSNNNPWTVNGWTDPSSYDENCKDSADDDGSVSPTSSRDLCVVGDVPYMTSAMNSQYYNPAILYTPGVNADGTSKPSQTTATSVLTDGYNKQNKTQLNVSVATINLTTGYPDRVWCTTNTPSAADLTDTSKCRKNSAYLYPDATYKYGRGTAATTNDKNVLGVYGAPYYYDVVPSEYCKAADLRVCIQSSVATGEYTFPAKSRWCSDTALTTCQATKTATYQYPRYIGSSTTAVAATGTLVVSGTSRNQNVSSIKINGVEILGATVSWGNTENDAGFAALIAAQITAYNSSPEYTATVSGTTITITSTLAAGASANGNATIVKTSGPNFSLPSSPDIKGGVTGLANAPYTFVRTDIVSSTTSYPKSTGRTDCTGTSCTYAQEMTNFSNWYAYYRTRMQGMKSAASLSFKTIDNRYRVGFFTLNNRDANYLPIARFDNLASGSEAVNQKAAWYSKLHNAIPSGSTPLRSTLTTVGQIFAGKKPIGSADPMQYSCQQNFSLLTTDGYWNSDGADDVQEVEGASLGNMDGSPVPRPMYEGPSASSGSLADASKYYYDTDLRKTEFGNCLGSLGAGTDVCENNVFVSSSDSNPQQHMTTFTLGLGVDGTLTYSKDYKTVKDLTSAPTDARLDYYNLFHGSGTPVVNWPVPVSGNETTVDDLWHAAVNSNGTYFSAKDPAQLSSGLNDALAAIGAKLGSGAAAATSTLDITPGDNFAYLATYTTVKWTGNLEARTIDVDTAEPSLDATWCVEDVVAGACSTPGSIVSDVSGGSKQYYCATPMAETDCASPGVWDAGTNTCKVEVATSCTGQMAARVQAGTDDRVIYFNKSGALTDFKYEDLTETQKGYFTGTGLSQWSTLTEDQKTAAGGSNLVNFLRGQTGYEDRAVNPVLDRLYRYREAVLGDVVESRPFFVGKPIFSYTDEGYSTYKETSPARTVFMGANDGMLHAFDADTGKERWAYIPSMVMANMWKLADKNYATMHSYFVNGNPVVGDIKVGTSWKRILVAGLNGGGKGYYALDITNPAAPSLLWEITTAEEPNLGYTFGQPVITKDKDGKWVVLLTSGYNTADDQGHLYVRDAYSGSKIRTIDISGSGLSRIATWADDPEKNNTAGYTYGGDLNGDLWRFDINAGTSVKFASFGATQPITTRPTLGKVGDNHVVYVATGKYLEVSDLSTVDVQSFYAIKDEGKSDADTVALSGSSTTLVKKTLSAGETERTVSGDDVDFNTDRGWKVDFPTPGERANVNPLLAWKTLLVPTIVPESTACSPGGYGWLNYFDYKTGGAVGGGVDDPAGLRFDDTIVGITPVKKSDGSGEVLITSGTGELEKPRKSVIPGGGGAGFVGKRVIWRELMR